MKLRFLKIQVFLLLITFFVPIVFAQTNGKTSPYVEGETLTYDARFSKLILRGVSIADLSFEVSKASEGNNYNVKAKAVSKGTLLKLFRFSFVQDIESTADATNYTAVKTIKHDEQGDRIRNSEATFDYNTRKVTYIEIDPKDSARPPRTIASAIETETYDLVSGIYILRNLPLTVGKTFVVNISDSGLVYQVPVRVTAREVQSTILGKVPCLRIEPEVFGQGRMVEGKGSMIIWITDDAKRIPVRSQLNTSIGRVEVRLRRIEVKK